MNNEKSLTPIKAFKLGALNGLIIGLLFEMARVTYLNYQLTQAAREYAQTDLFVDFTEARWQPLFPLGSIAVFAVVAYLINKFFLNRPRLLLLIWLGMGISALALGYFMSTSTPDILSFLSLFGLVVVGYLVHRLWKTHPNSPILLWAVNGISAVIAVAVGVQLVGLFFYGPELRKPFTWLMCLFGVIAINTVFGAVVQVLFNRFGGGRFKEANAQ